MLILTLLLILKAITRGENCKIAHSRKQQLSNCFYCRFEKVVSDIYLSDILWRVCIGKVAEGKLFNGKLPPTLDKDTFVSFLNGIANNKECFAGNK